MTRHTHWAAGYTCNQRVVGHGKVGTGDYLWASLSRQSLESLPPSSCDGEISPRQYSNLIRRASSLHYQHRPLLRHLDLQHNNHLTKHLGVQYNSAFHSSRNNDIGGHNRYRQSVNSNNIMLQHPHSDYVDQVIDLNLKDKFSPKTYIDKPVYRRPFQNNFLKNNQITKSKNTCIASSEAGVFNKRCSSHAFSHYSRSDRMVRSFRSSLKPNTSDFSNNLDIDSLSSYNSSFNRHASLSSQSLNSSSCSSVPQSCKSFVKLAQSTHLTESQDYLTIYDNVGDKDPSRYNSHIEYKFKSVEKLLLPLNNHQFFRSPSTSSSSTFQGSMINSGESSVLTSPESCTSLTSPSSTTVTSPSSTNITSPATSPLHSPHFETSSTIFLKLCDSPTSPSISSTSENFSDQSIDKQYLVSNTSKNSNFIAYKKQYIDNPNMCERNYDNYYDDVDKVVNIKPYRRQYIGKCQCSASDITSSHS